MNPCDNPCASGLMLKFEKLNGWAPESSVQEFSPTNTLAPPSWHSCSFMFTHGTLEASLGQALCSPVLCRKLFRNSCISEGIRGWIALGRFSGRPGVPVVLLLVLGPLHFRPEQEFHLTLAPPSWHSCSFMFTHGTLEASLRFPPSTTLTLPLVLCSFSPVGSL